METKKQTITEVNLTINDLKRILCEHLYLEEGEVNISVINKTEIIQGIDLHDASYIEVFDGIKLINKL